MRRPSLPFLTVAATIALAAFASPSGAAGCAHADLSASVSNVPSLKLATLCLLNAERAREGLAAIRASAQLGPIADRYSRDMVRQQFFSHVSPSGQTLAKRLSRYTARASGWAIGENLGWGEMQLATPRSIVKAWMDSAGHRANILNGRFREIGIGIAIGTPVRSSPQSATYTTEFGSPGTRAGRRVRCAHESSRPRVRRSVRPTARGDSGCRSARHPSRPAR